MRAPSLAVAQNTYKENVVAVNTVVTNVLSSSLPTLNQNPPDWNDFTSAYVQANADALNWVNNVMARLLDVPDEVKTYNSVISGLLQDALTQTNTLISNPSNAAALTALNNDLSGVSSQLSLVNLFISGAVTNIQNFQDILPNMATQLQTIANKSTQDANADQQQIDALKQDIKNLYSDIDDLTAQIVALGIVDGVALTLGTVATIAAWPFGALTWLVMGPAVAAASTFIALDAVKIKDDKAKIKADQDKMNDLTADVATLHLLAQSYQKLADDSTAVEQNLQAVLTEWLDFENDINQAISDIQTAVNDSSACNFSAVKDDLNAAVTEWNDTYTKAGDLHLDLQVNNAELQLGMSQSQVSAALASGTTMGIIQYYNHFNQVAV